MFQVNDISWHSFELWIFIIRNWFSFYVRKLQWYFPLEFSNIRTFSKFQNPNILTLPTRNMRCNISFFTKTLKNLSNVIDRRILIQIKSHTFVFNSICAIQFSFFHRIFFNFGLYPFWYEMISFSVRISWHHEGGVCSYVNLTITYFYRKMTDFSCWKDNLSQNYFKICLSDWKR